MSEVHFSCLFIVGLIWFAILVYHIQNPHKLPLRIRLAANGIFFSFLCLTPIILWGINDFISILGIFVLLILTWDTVDDYQKGKLS
jgi:hypothetical protein